MAALSSEQLRILQVAADEGAFVAASIPDKNRILRLHGMGLVQRHPTELERCTITAEGRAALTGGSASDGRTPLPHHPLAALFPMLSDDIATRGQEEPDWLLDGQILDGRNREAACALLGIDAWTKEYEGNDPLGFVLSLNLHRRHLTESQRAMVAARVVDWERGMCDPGWPGSGACRGGDQPPGARRAGKGSARGRKEDRPAFQGNPGEAGEDAP